MLSPNKLTIVGGVTNYPVTERFPNVGTFTNGRLLSDGMGVKGTVTASSLSSPIS